MCFFTSFSLGLRNYTDKTGPWEPTEDGLMNQMPLSSRRRNQHSRFRGLMSTALHLDHRDLFITVLDCLATIQRGRNVYFLSNHKYRKRETL